MNTHILTYIYTPIHLHSLVIDTAFLYLREGAPDHCPGLKELSKYVLG